MTYRIPAVLWASAFVGLIVALVADGVFDALGVALLGVPCVVLTRLLVRALRKPSGASLP
jgi:hypothetical protein